MNFDNLLENTGIIAIVRDVSADTVTRVMNALFDGGIRQADDGDAAVSGGDRSGTLAGFDFHRFSFNALNRSGVGFGNDIHNLMILELIFHVPAVDKGDLIAVDLPVFRPGVEAQYFQTHLIISDLFRFSRMQINGFFPEDLPA